MVGREGECMMDPRDSGGSGGEFARQASFSVLTLPWCWEEEIEEDKGVLGILNGKTTI